ncbi:MAG: hypothetical protein HXS50_05100, partial [Theionarchaea archaeon]|nr:hypothetical protein [Theionarchaea archaeon]
LKAGSGAGEPCIVLEVSGSGPAEGYSIVMNRDRVSVVGNDPRGMLFGTGRLLRLLKYGEGYLAIPGNISIESRPDQSMRGHQLGYRPRSNTYDSWGLDEYEQYIRELIVWGVNSIELIPPVTSPEVMHRYEFGRKAWDMTIGLSKLLHEYHLGVHLWMAVNDHVLPGMEVGDHKPGDRLCPSRPEDREWMLEIRRNLFSEMKRIDGVFIPGGDPGGCDCPRCTPWGKTLLPLAEDVGRVLIECHPDARIWLSNQMFSREESDHLYDFIEKQRPDWLGGLVYSPWVPDTVEHVRSRLHESYPLRNYPDVCHSVRCQFPVEDWDAAYGMIVGREGPNQRPRAFHRIHTRYSEYFAGSISYSDGVNDDLNKFVFSALDWDMDTPLEDILLDYARYFIGEDLASEVTGGLLRLEENWVGELSKNESVEETLAIWQDIERRAGNRMGNWRFQMHLFRAYLDAYIRRKLLEDIELEREANGLLRSALAGDVSRNLRSAIDVLRKKTGDEILRKRVEELAGDLNRSIGMKLGRAYGAHPERADVLDHLDQPLNNSEWMIDEICRILDSGPEGKTMEIERIVEWENPGEGGFYDDLGNPGHQPHLVREKKWEDDPGGIERSIQELDFKRMEGGRMSWRRQAQTLWGRPMQMAYSDLDPNHDYRLRVTYGGYRHRATLRLDAGDIEIHPPIELPAKSTQFEFELPGEATGEGNLQLTWSMVRNASAK